MKRLYKCPLCGNGHRAPERMAADDVRRYCLDCSRKTGKLVARVVPALEREREAKRERSKLRVQQKTMNERQRERARWTVAGVHVLDEARKLIKLKAFDDLFEVRQYLSNGKSRMVYQLPEIVLRRSKTKFYSGHCRPSRQRIVITLGEQVDSAVVRMVLLHELCHVASGWNGVEAHNDAYKKLYAKAAFEAWGVDASPYQAIYTGLDEDIVRQLREQASNASGQEAA